MAVTVGDRLGHYDVTALIGSPGTSAARTGVRYNGLGWRH